MPKSQLLAALRADVSPQFIELEDVPCPRHGERGFESGQAPGFFLPRGHGHARDPEDPAGRPLAHPFAQDVQHPLAKGLVVALLRVGHKTAPAAPALPTLLPARLPAGYDDLMMPALQILSKMFAFHPKLQSRRPEFVHPKISP